MLAMLTIELPGCITRPQAWATQYAPLRLTSITERNCSGVSRVAGGALPPPALLIRISTRPKVCMAESTSAWHWSGTLTSVATASDLRPAASTSPAVSDSLSTRRAPNTTSAPASAKAWANATPSPDDAPVTITTLSSSRNESSTLIQKTPLLSGCRPASEATVWRHAGRKADRLRAKWAIAWGGKPPDQRPFGVFNSRIFPTRIQAAYHSTTSGPGCPPRKARLRCSEQNRAWEPRRCDDPSLIGLEPTGLGPKQE